VLCARPFGTGFSVLSWPTSTGRGRRRRQNNHGEITTEHLPCGGGQWICVFCFFVEVWLVQETPRRVAPSPTISYATVDTLKACSCSIPDETAAPIRHTRPPPFALGKAVDRLVAGAVEGLLVGVLEGEGGGGAILPRLGAEVVVEAGAGGHGLGVEVGGERAVLHQAGVSCQASSQAPSSSSSSRQAATRPGSKQQRQHKPRNLRPPQHQRAAHRRHSRLSRQAPPPRDPPKGGGRG
jgi:hypothetical protein